MQLNHCAELEQYLEHLRASPEEIQALFDDLLISVTTFFRDPEAWEALRVNAIVPLVEQSDPTDQIRVWVPGCATGEEAYSIAMLLRDEIDRRERHRDFVVFGSDVDQGALATAREGVYPASIAADVTEPRLARYFRAEGEHYRVAPEIRDCVVFAAHSVLRDPPFSRLHLVSCRNLLIYLDRELQQELRSIFRYSLRDDGYLFIGISESADNELFEPIDKQHRIFRARTRAADGPPVRIPHGSPVAHALSIAVIEQARERATRRRRAAGEIHLELLEQHAPPSVVIDADWSVAHLSGSAGRYLQPPGGAPTSALTELVRPELLDELRSALHQAFEKKAACLSAFVPVHFNGAPQRVAVLVQPRIEPDGDGSRALVIFLEAGPADGDAVEAKPPTDAIVSSLRDKLRIAGQRLESMRQEHSVAIEDLRAANEELQSLNEEYRSTTEELETSKEELQSVNEELQTVNNELRMKLDEVSRANDDLENFMAATEMATLFLDRRLCITRYTAPLRALFSVKPHDRGRPIGDLTHSLDYPDLEENLRDVLENLTPIERTVDARDGAVYVVRIRPYRTAGDKIDGLVVTFRGQD